MKDFLKFIEGNRGRRGGLMVIALYSGSSSPGSSPGRGYCVLGQDTFLSQRLSPPRCGNPVMDGHPIRGGVEILLVA